jgi:hypothetical protein
VGFHQRYGSYVHADHETTVSISKQGLENDAGELYAQRVTWNVSGQILGDDTSAVVTACAALEAAYRERGRDARLYDASGNVVAELTDGNALTGVRVVQPVAYPLGDGAQFSTFRDYTVVLSADYLLDSGLRSRLRAFTEAVTLFGGGPVRDVVECVNAPAQEQVVSAFSAYRATQSGRAVGIFDYPAAPAPLWPAKLARAGTFTRETPRRINGRDVDFPLSYQFEFVSGTPLLGVPNRFPG